MSECTVRSELDSPPTHEIGRTGTATHYIPQGSGRASSGPAWLPAARLPVGSGRHLMTKTSAMYASSTVAMWLQTTMVVWNSGSKDYTRFDFEGEIPPIFSCCRWCIDFLCLLLLCGEKKNSEKEYKRNCESLR
ncbi:hypothetical protein D1007_51718 [Hordeum vulgare]|uniref:Predicted protein n=1 Tax=Hordeum vulgare subsp. vulgare TaxID=112509 RepID=F2EAX1_HORVV|nr:hypothetical protein D1007_51718 [Hordeum vulgare]BAK04493.1 predicted protein [Hordeum vulgare subsp. vulgare]